MSFPKHVSQVGKLKKTEAFSGIITKNEEMLSLMQYVESVAASSEPVLITGETGVGKELIARAIHHLSNRKGSLVPVNVAGLDDNIFSDTLFGHERGAYTGAEQARMGQVERAAGGTLFLDEIGDLGLSSQVKLLRLLQEGEFLRLGCDDSQYMDCRIIAATNVDIWDLQRKGKFRKDLNFRLRTHHIHIPPLRERIDDIKPLTEYFVDVASNSYKKTKPQIPAKLHELLSPYSFPGNVRELQAMVFDAVIRSKSDQLDLYTFQSHIDMSLGHKKEGKAAHLTDETEVKDVIFPVELPTIKEINALLVQEAMRRSDGNQTVAAATLGISRQALGKRLKNL